MSQEVSNAQSLPLHITRLAPGEQCQVGLLANMQPDSEETAEVQLHKRGLVYNRTWCALLAPAMNGMIQWTPAYSWVCMHRASAMSAQF